MNLWKSVAVAIILPRNPFPDIVLTASYCNTLRPRQNGRHFPDDIFQLIFLNENISISFKISMKFVPNGLINNIPTFVQIMAWRRTGDKPLSEPMIVTHVCVTRPQWVLRLLPRNMCRCKKTPIIRLSIYRERLWPCGMYAHQVTLNRWSLCLFEMMGFIWLLSYLMQHLHGDKEGYYMPL